MRKLLLLSLVPLLVWTCKKEDPLPMADFEMSYNNAIEPCTVTFINKSANASTFAWFFGDGSTSGDENPEYIYEHAGTYEVTLVASKNGVKSTKKINFDVHPPQVSNRKYCIKNSLPIIMRDVRAFHLNDIENLVYDIVNFGDLSSGQLTYVRSTLFPTISVLFRDEDYYWLSTPSTVLVDGQTITIELTENLNFYRYTSNPLGD